MGVQKHAHPQHRAVGRENLPPIGVVVLTGIGVADRDIKSVRAVAACANLQGDHVRLARERVPEGGPEPERARSD